MKIVSRKARCMVKDEGKNLQRYVGGREGVGQLVQAKNWGISHAHISNENEFNPPVR